MPDTTLEGHIGLPSFSAGGTLSLVRVYEKGPDGEVDTMQTMGEIGRMLTNLECYCPEDYARLQSVGLPPAPTAAQVARTPDATAASPLEVTPIAPKDRAITVTLRPDAIELVSRVNDRPEGKPLVITTRNGKWTDQMTLLSMLAYSGTRGLSLRDALEGLQDTSDGAIKRLQSKMSELRDKLAKAEIDPQALPALSRQGLTKDARLRFCAASVKSVGIKDGMSRHVSIDEANRHKRLAGGDSREEIEM
jgi:hypothetical protein